MRNAARDISPMVAVATGLLLVNGPVLALLVGVPALVWFWAGEPETFGEPGGIAVAVSLGAGFAIAWLWWSLSVPRWRVWAYRRVRDLGKLNRYAVLAGVIWPRGHFLERTEIKSPELKALEESLERQAGYHP